MFKRTTFPGGTWIVNLSGDAEAYKEYVIIRNPAETSIQNSSVRQSMETD